MKKPPAAKPAQPTALPLPHEREQASGHVNTEPQPKMKQAQRDIEAGLVDTDMRATPGLNAQRRARMVKVKKPARPR